MTDTNNISAEQETLLEFPCDFQLKVMGYNQDDFAEQMRSLAQKHLAEKITDDHIIIKPSRTGKFLSVNINFEAHSKKQIDDIYRELTAHKLVTMAL